MKEEKNTVLVAWDFSIVAMYAFDHAMIFAKNLGVDITLVHIVKSHSKIEGQTKKMEEAAIKIENAKGIKPNIIVAEGNIFSTINDIADEVNAALVLMGTHGIKGMQKLTGSWALKVIIGSKVPFVVIQSPPIREEYNSVVFPVNFKKENKEKLSWVDFLSKLFKAKVRIITPRVDPGRLLAQTNANLNFAKKYFNARDIDFEIDISESDDDFAEETIAFAKRIEADLMIILTTKNIALHDYIMGAHEQYIIANSANIPVMCINPRTDLTKYGSFY